MRRVAVVLCLLFPLLGQAAIEVAQFDNPEQEARYKQLIAELRCLVCQNQNLADSNAELAQDMRHKTYQMVKDGASTDDVVDYMVKRYGDFVLYRPPLRFSTLFLWVGPFVILGGGVLFLLLFIRRRARQPAAGISESDLKRAKALLGEEENNT
ncbi:MAG: cytochrome c-type biogenesis protein CcmH [Sedimenticola sp.]|nr:cytochrome c-type biogenesis protein CcmH [Sedimenticola sp.]